MSQVFQCHYMRAAILRNNKVFHSSDYNGKHEQFLFQFPHIDINQGRFNNYQKRFLEFSRSKKNVIWKAKDELMSKYSMENWQKLGTDVEKLHTLHVCEPCKFIVFGEKTSTTPVTPVTPVTPLQSLDLNSIPLPDTPKSRNDPAYQVVMAKSYLDKDNEHWNQQFGTNFTDVLTKVPEANLTQKLTASEKKKKARNTHFFISTVLQMFKFKSIQLHVVQFSPLIDCI